VAHQELDIKNAKSNHGNSGFTAEERGCMTKLLDSGFSDTFRTLYPEQGDSFTWWSFMPKVRERNVGWRIDYFLVSERLVPAVKEAGIDSHVLGSDHCPVTLTLEME
jgi:exodeoxyribonuclease-3